MQCLLLACSCQKWILVSRETPHPCPHQYPEDGAPELAYAVQEELFCDEFHLVDLRVYDNCKKIVKGCEHVFNLAADMGGMGFIQSNHSVIMYNNTMISFNMVEVARIEGVKRWVLPLLFPPSLQPPLPTVRYPPPPLLLKVPLGSLIWHAQIDPTISSGVVKMDYIEECFSAMVQLLEQHKQCAFWTDCITELVQHNPLSHRQILMDFQAQIKTGSFAALAVPVAQMTDETEG